MKALILVIAVLAYLHSSAQFADVKIIKPTRLETSAKGAPISSILTTICLNYHYRVAIPKSEKYSSRLITHYIDLKNINEDLERLKRRVESVYKNLRFTYTIQDSCVLARITKKQK